MSFEGEEFISCILMKAIVGCHVYSQQIRRSKPTAAIGMRAYRLLEPASRVASKECLQGRYLEMRPESPWLASKECPGSPGLASKECPGSLARNASRVARVASKECVQGRPQGMSRIASKNMCSGSLPRNASRVTSKYTYRAASKECFLVRQCR